MAASDRLAGRRRTIRQQSLLFGRQQRPLEVADVAIVALDAIRDPRRGKKVGLGGRRQRHAAHHGPQPMQPQRQPTALKAGVAGDQHPLAAPECHAHAHTFQGA